MYHTFVLTIYHCFIDSNSYCTPFQ